MFLLTGPRPLKFCGQGKAGPGNCLCSRCINLPERKQLSLSSPSSRPPSFLSFHFSSMPNNRPMARTRMKGRLLPNLEVHRSLQAPNRGCSKNPETEQSGVIATAPRAHGNAKAAPRVPRASKHYSNKIRAVGKSPRCRPEPPRPARYGPYKSPSPCDLPWESWPCPTPTPFS